MRVLNMNIKKVKSSNGVYGIAYTKEANHFQNETATTLKSDYNIHLFLGTSGIVPSYKGSKNNIHYYAFNSKDERDTFIRGL